MDIAGGEHGDTGVSMLAVLPGEEGSAERGRGVDVVEAAREAGMVLEKCYMRIFRVHSFLALLERKPDPTATLPIKPYGNHANRRDASVEGTRALKDP